MIDIYFQGKVDLMKRGAKLVYKLKDPDSARYILNVDNNNYIKHDTELLCTHR